MQRFNGQLINQFPNTVNGNAAAGAQVTIRLKSSGSLVTLYATNSTGGATLPNPLTADAKGYYGFYAPDGVYTLDVSISGTPQLEIQLQDVADLQAQFNAAIANAGYVPVGTFAAGCTVSQANGVVSDGSTYWRWDGALPKTVTAGSSPLPVGVGGWFLVSDGGLRGDLAATNSTVLVGGVEANELALASKITQLAVESFRQSGFSDSQTIQAALDYALSMQSLNRMISINLEAGRTYTYDSTGDYKTINNLIINLNGATLKRANAGATKTTLAEAAGVGQSALFLSSIPNNWKVGDFLSAYTGPSDTEVSKNIVRILAINPELGNRITTNAGFGSFDGLTTLPVGLTIAKKYQAFAGRPSADEVGLVTPAGVNSNVHIVGPGVVDGNRTNQENFSWYFNTEMFFSGANCSVSSKIRFTEIAGETIVGHGVKVIDNDFENLNGSAFHTSMHDDSLAEATVSIFANNRVKRANLITQAVSGHCEGAVTFSWGAGRLIIANNEFSNGEESVLGGFGPSNEAENPDKWLIFSGNICEDYNNIFYGITAPVEGVVVTNNIFANCGDNSTIMSALMIGKTNTVANNVAVAGTILTGVARSTNASFGSITGALTGMQLAVGSDVAGFDLTRMASYRSAMMHESSAFQAFATGDAGLSGFAFFTSGGPSSGDLFAFFNSPTNSFDFTGNDSSIIQRVKFNGVRPQFNSINSYAGNAEATSAGLSVGDVYRKSTGELMIVY